ncbi:MAG: hypothetical protein RTU92_04985 [Candidatus Thorarchaeota archaeon]
MKPIGTITMYFPFMDSKTREIILTLMNNASNYHDFVHDLNQMVCEVETTELCVFFATHHAAVLFNFNLLERIAKIFGNLLIIRPNLFIASALQGRKEDLNKAREAADEVISSNPPEWVQLEMNVTKLEAEMLSHPDVLYDDSTINTIYSILDRNPSLDFFNSRVYHTLVTQHLRDGTLEDAIQYIDNAISNAEIHDDLNRLARLYRTKATTIQHSDMKQSVELLLKSLEIMEVMGDIDGLGITIFHLSKIEAIRGEYDQAINHNLRIVTLRQSIGRPIHTVALTVSTLFNMTNNADAGLEWARMAEEEFAPSHKPRAILNQAWSLIIQRNHTEAVYIIDSVREAVFKSGNESHLAAFYLVNGFLEMIEEDHYNAAVNLEQALDIYEKHGSLMSANICSYYLAANEVYSIESSTSAIDSNVGPWLSLLEEKAVSDDLPGILGKALVLKTKLFFYQGKNAEAQVLLEQLGLLVKECELEFLQQEYYSLMERV